MLKNDLLAWCQNKYDNSHAGHCEQNCNNADACAHDCNECLKQVHWFPMYGGRCDYNCVNLLLKYVLKYTDKYSSQIADALQCINTSNYPRYNIFSIGCGAAPDLMAFEEMNDDKQIYYKGYDRNHLWQIIHNIIEKYTSTTDNLKAKLRQYDIFDVFKEGKPQNVRYNVVVIQYLLSHLYNTNQNDQIEILFDYIISNILANRLYNSPFLIIITDIDSMNKGRNAWYTLLDKLEDSGYSGIAYARSAYDSGDLGQIRWSNHEKSSVFGNIIYNYSKNTSATDRAQLIIELR